MTSAQEIGQKVQDQTLDAVRKAQDGVVDAVTAWTETANKLTAQLPDFLNDYKVPEFADFTKQFPDAVEVIGANFDFAEQVLANHREFALRLVGAAK